MITQDTPNTTSQNAPVCREIVLTDLVDTGWFDYNKVVEPKEAPTDRRPMSDFTDAILPGRKVEALGRQDMINLDRWDRAMQPTSLFFQTVHECFANHYPLALRPEMLWFLVMHEVATTVKLYPGHYRELFTASPDTLDIHVRDDSLVKGSPDNDWTVALRTFCRKLGTLIPGGMQETMLVPFSTLSAESQAASIIGLMDAASPFYDYHTHTMCGLPKIRLLGEVEDYLKLATFERGRTEWE